MTEKAPPATDRIRSAELIAATCLATDLGMGFPFEHGLHATLMAMRLADLAGVDSNTASQTYYACLLIYSGCTTDAEDTARIFGQSLTDHMLPVDQGSRAQLVARVIRALPPSDTPLVRRPYEIARRLPMAARYQAPHYAATCEVATMLAERLGLPVTVQKLFAYLTERWDGAGVLERARKDEIPLPLRIARVARDAAYQRLIGDNDYVKGVIGERAGHAFDPEIAKLFVTHADEILGEAGPVGSVWKEVLDTEPCPLLTLDSQEVDRAIAAMGNFADLVSPSLAGHSERVAALAESAGRVAGLEQGDVALARRAGHVHDLGRVAVNPLIWQRSTQLSADDWEQVRLHAYQTERILSPSPFLAALASIACAHHERLDGSGYHRGVGAESLPPVARLLAAADAFQSMTEPRAHRRALTTEEAAQHLIKDAGAGRHDPDLAAAVVEAAGLPAPHIPRPAGLTERESEVIGLLARGLQTKQVAWVLNVSKKTADTHIQNVYRKLGVSSRAAATLFAMEHGMVPSGELPIF